MTYTLKDKEFKLIPRTRNVVELTERLKTKNLNDLIFTGLADGNPKMLAELIKAFAEYEDGKATFTSINVVYDFIDEWKRENEKTIDDLYAEVAKVVNEMGFFKKKMTEEELEKALDQPAISINLQEIVANSVQTAMNEIAQEEFKGYKG